MTPAVVAAVTFLALAVVAGVVVALTLVSAAAGLAGVLG